MSKQTKPDQTGFIRQLQKINEDRGKCAALRKYWSPTTRHQSYPVLGLLGALGDERKTVTAALFAEHPEHRENISIGKAALLLGDRKDGEHPYDRNFRRLLACDDLTDLGQQLHRLIKRISRKGIGLDYTDLHKRLNYWTNYREDVKLRWASDFWQAPQMEINEPVTQS